MIRVAARPVLNTGAKMSAVAAMAGSKSTATYTISGLKKWSCIDKKLPGAKSITSIHVYDFDNTLFNTPIPNAQMWAPGATGLLMNEDVFVNGGWWHDPSLLEMTGDGADVEAARGWKGWWNEQIVQLVQLSASRPEVVTVLMTGRKQDGFAELIQRIVKSRSLDFDMICLKPKEGPNGEKLGTTMKYKQVVLEYLMQVYYEAEEMRVYEDRPKHVEGFRQFFASFNEKYAGLGPVDSELLRKRAINAEVIDVPPGESKLDPEKELTHVRLMVQRHNEQLASLPPGSSKRPFWIVNKHVHFIGYMVAPQDSDRMLQVANLGSYSSRGDGVIRYANTIVISYRTPLPQRVQQEVGGLKSTLRWKAVALGNWENKVFALRVAPVPITANFHVAASVPHVLLALKGGTRMADSSRITTWTPLPEQDQFEFETVVDEKASVRLDEDRMMGMAKRPQKPGLNNNNKRSRVSDGTKDSQHHAKVQNQRGGGGGGQGRGGFSTAANAGGGRQGGQSKHSSGKGGKGGASRGGASGKKGRGNFGNYRSLDDIATGGGGGGAQSSGMDGAADDGGLSY